MKDRPNFKKKTYAWMPRNRLLLDLMSSPVGVLGINWAFQGMLGMDRTDRWFKLGLDAIITFGVAGLLIPFVSPWAAFAGAFLLAHTSNWLFNTHFFVIGRFVGFTATPVERIPAYTRGVGERVAYSPAILAAAVYGAVSRGAGVRTTSDVDVRFIRRPGWGNGLRAACFTFTERARAFFAGFPLDLYLLDDLHRLEEMRPDEKPILLYDPDGLLQRYYAGRGYEWLEPQN